MRFNSIALIAILTSSFFSQDFNEEVREIAIMGGGRVQPFDTYARRLFFTVYGNQNFQFEDWNTEPAITAFRLICCYRLADSNDKAASIIRKFESMPFIRIDHLEVKGALGLNTGQMHFTITEVLGNRGEEDASPKIQRLATLLKAAGDEKTKEAVENTKTRIGMTRTLRNLHAFKVLPMPTPDGSWVTMQDGEDFARGGASEAAFQALSKKSADLYTDIANRFDELARKYIASNFQPVHGPEVRAWKEAIKRLNPDLIPEGRINSEVMLNTLKPFTICFYIYIVSSLCAIIMVITKKWGWLYVLPAIAGFILHAIGIGLRAIVAQRPPFSNMYESLILLALAVVLVALFIELFSRSRYYLLAGSIIAAVLLGVSNMGTAFDPFIGPILPALQSLWMIVHVPSMMIGYASAGIAGFIGHSYLYKNIFGKKSEDELVEVESQIYRALKVTILFMLTGVILGAVWAGEAWGRPWGWDMKETWALITLLFYVVIAHGRLVNWIKGIWLAVLTVLGIVLVTFTYYGVNYVFSRGLHSYGKGNGHTVVLYTIGGIEIAVAAAALIVYYCRKPKCQTKEISD